MKAGLEPQDLSDLNQAIAQLQEYSDKIQQHLLANQPDSVPALIYTGTNLLATQLPKIKKTIAAIEEERHRLNALAEIGQLVNSSLELDVVLETVMDTIIQLIRADRGFLMLADKDNRFVIRVARNWEKESLDKNEFEISRTVVQQVTSQKQAILTTNAQLDPRFNDQQSVVAFNLRSILAVPLKLKTELIGVIYADNRFRSGIFTRKELDILEAFANQAAVAIENARLFDSVRQTLARVNELNNLLDNVFASITSGVLTADRELKIAMCNRSAEKIMGLAPQDIIGRNIEELFIPLNFAMQEPLRQVLTQDELVVGLEGSSSLPERGRVDLRLSLSPLKDADDLTRGVVVVMEDLTEKKKLEASRALFERMVSPKVIEQLNPNQLQLGGQKNIITTLFADIRGFTGFSEMVDPEKLVFILNQYLAAAAEAVLAEDGTIDKFLGDAVMAWFNAPIPQPDHALRAVYSALGIKKAITTLQSQLSFGHQLGFGVGIHMGEAVLGLVGTEKRLDYTAIGDSVNTAKRIQENAGLGQILISEDVHTQVADFVIATLHESILVKGKREPIRVYEVHGIK